MPRYAAALKSARARTHLAASLQLGEAGIDECLDADGAGADDGVGTAPVKPEVLAVRFGDRGVAEDDVGDVAGAFPRVVGFEDPVVGDADHRLGVVEGVEGD